MKEKLKEFAGKYWLNLILYPALIIIAIVFAGQIKQLIGVYESKKTIYEKPIPVDPSKDLDTLTCIERRIDPAIMDLCTGVEK